MTQNLKKFVSSWKRVNLQSSISNALYGNPSCSSSYGKCKNYVNNSRKLWQSRSNILGNFKDSCSEKLEEAEIKKSKNEEAGSKSPTKVAPMKTEDNDGVINLRWKGKDSSYSFFFRPHVS